MKIKMLYVFFLMIVLGFFLNYFISQIDKEDMFISHHATAAESDFKKVMLPEEHPSIHYQNSLWRYMNKGIEKFINEYGEPDRKDASSYGYEWWVYKEDKSYIKLAVKEKQIVSMYSNRSEIDFSPLTIGQHREEIEGTYTLADEIAFDNLRFKLSDKDLKERPIVRISDQVYAQLYMDTFTDNLAGVRFINKEMLEVLKPYELYYAGDVIEPEEPTSEKWEDIEQGMEKQIFELTNELREEYDLDTLLWEEKAAKAAKLHSQDMKENNYFSHFSLDGDGLKERLMESKTYYLSAGENIAAHYPDAIAVMHGWLNSEGHREAILKEEYTHLGVGVDQSYYTQNFLSQ